MVELPPGKYLKAAERQKHLQSGAGDGDMRFASCLMQGWRAHMEDAQTTLTSLKTPFESWSFFGVFDGHKGDTVSQYCAQHLLGHVLDCKEMMQSDGACHLLPDEVIIRSLTTGFDRADAALRLLPSVLSGTDRSGSTAVCALVSHRAIYLANCGDSRGIVVSRGALALATEDHKPSSPSERARIERAGGHVVHQRVGTLAVSRGLGDFAHKDTPLLKVKPNLEGVLVSAQPDVTIWLRSDEDEFVLLASDGVWDVMSSEAVVQFVRQRLPLTDDMERICGELVDECFDKGSRDNISVVLIGLPGSSRPSEEARSLEQQLQSSVEAEVSRFGQQMRANPKLADYMDVRTVNYMVTRCLEEKGVKFPPGTSISARRILMEKTWKKVNPEQELHQVPRNGMDEGFMEAAQYYWDAGLIGRHSHK